MPEDKDNDDRVSVASADSSPRRTRPRSLRSWRSRSRPRSRPEPDAHLHRIYSSGFIDDHGTYVNTRDSSSSGSQPRTASSSIGEEQAPEDLEEVEKPEISHDAEDIAPESDGTVDLEKARTAAPSLNRQQTNKSGRSVRDPNVVNWKGVDDPENPKNWSKLYRRIKHYLIVPSTFRVSAESILWHGLKVEYSGTMRCGGSGRRG